MVIPTQPTRRLGELLVQRRLITPGQLEQALLQQRSTREFLGMIIVRMGLIKPEALLVTLSEQFGLPHESLRSERVDWSIAKQFPKSALSEGRCFPIRADAESVTVAIANPLDAWALSAIEQAAGFRKVKAVLVLEKELQDVLARYHQQSLQTIEAQLKHDDKTQ